MKAARLTLACMLSVAILGCVIRTEHRIDAHIQLDIRHVEEEVAGVFDFVDGTSEEMPVIEAEPESSPTSWLDRGRDFLSPVRVVHAQAKTSPAIDKLAKRMKARNTEVSKWKTAGCLGENNRGYVALRDCDASKDSAKKNIIQKLLAEENKDRKAFYNEFAKLKKITVSTMEKVGAKDKLKRAKKGEAVQLPPAGKTFDEFKKSPKGKALAAQCKPGAWVKMP
jgi:uncharacterized protein